MVNHHALTNAKANFLSFSISKFFAYFTLLFILIFIVLPIFKFIYLILLSDFLNTENLFSSIASNYYFVLILKNLAQALLSTVCSLIIGLPAAFFLYQFDFPGRKIIIILCTIPFILPVIVVALAFREVFVLFSNFNFNESLLIIIFAHAYYNMSVVIRIVGPYWRKINKDLEDASELLGASLIARFKYIISPMLAPVVFSSAVLVFLFSFTSFGIILIFGNTDFETVELLIYRFSTGLYNLQLAIWFSLFQIMFCTALFFLFSRFNQTSDLGFLNTPSKLRVLGENDRRLGFGTTYLNASGDVSLKNFTDALVPIISGSRLSETKEIEELFFPNALSASYANYAPNPKFYANSSSFKAADVESIADSNNLFRSFYQGTKNTRETTFDKKEPIEVLIVSPTKIVTQDSDISKLKTK